MSNTTKETVNLEVRIGDNGVVQLKLDALSPEGQASFREASSDAPEWLDDGANPRPCKVLNWRCVLATPGPGLPPIGSETSPDTE